MTNMREKLFVARSYVRNAVSSKELSYIVEPTQWATRMVGENITNELERQNILRAAITTTPLFIRNSIVHYGSLPAQFTSKGFRKAHRSCRIVATVFHIHSNEQRERIREVNHNVDVFHTPSSITAREMMHEGVSQKKIIIIPLGVSNHMFYPLSDQERILARKRFGIDNKTIVVGSFQKDGIGWEDGMRPKMEKGPDIFVETCKILSVSYSIHVMLVGPARGYVAHELRKFNIPFTHVGYLRDYKEIAKYYHVLDVYVIPSRIEGGPLALLEAWASGIPVVSTPCGMVPDIVVHTKTAYITNAANADELAKHVHDVINNTDVRNKLVMGGLEQIRHYYWPQIARLYYKRLYKQLLQT